MFRLIRALFGDGAAQMSLAIDSWLVPVEKRNRSRARYWARRAAKSGVPDAGRLLGVILFDPSLPDEVFGRELYAECEPAAAAGDAVAQYSLGWCHEQGVGVPKDLQQALYWYTTAAAMATPTPKAAWRFCVEGRSEKPVRSPCQSNCVFSRMNQSWIGTGFDLDTRKRIDRLLTAPLLFI